MEITPTTTRTPATATATQSGVISGDFDMFLKMLTVQMQNQDPLNPIDSADYAVQLATFSGVEQQTRTNQLLENLASRFDLMGLSELAGWVGNEARAAVPVAFDGTMPVDLTFAADTRADRAVLVVRNASGAIVAREDVSPAATTLEWQGQDAAGEPLGAGTYTLTLESYAGDTWLDTQVVESYARIDEVVAASTGTRLILAGGHEIAASSVTGLRRLP